MPLGFETFSDSLRCGVEIFHHLKKVLGDKGMSTAVGDEGGFAPDLKTTEEALDVIMTAISNAGYQAGVVSSLDGIGALLRDSSGIVWIGTWGGGLNFHNTQNNAFRTLRHSPTRSESLSDSFIFSLFGGRYTRTGQCRLAHRPWGVVGQAHRRDIG